MSHRELNRFSSLELRNGKRLRNRVVVPPMASGTASESGLATDRTVGHYAALAESGAGLVMVEYTYVHPSGRSEENQLGLSSDAHVADLERVARAIHARGALAGIQLTHAGGKTSRDLTGGALMAPSRIAVPVKDREMETPDAMSLEEIALWKRSFARAYARAEAAGFDLVELHAAHGYGLNQWLSPITNRRADGYGGSVPANARLLLETLAYARRAHPWLLLAVRLPGHDFLEGGLRIEDTIWIARELERLGIDVIDVSSGIGGWRRPRDRAGEGYLVQEAAAIQRAVRVPVIGVGGIENGEYIDERISRNDLSLAAVGRAILKNPRDWREANLRAQPAPGRRKPMTRFVSAALLALALFPSLASADCTARCRHAIDPDACRQACEANPELVAPADPGEYCRSLFSSDPREWWRECGGTVSPPPGETGGLPRHCPDAPHCI